MEQIVKEGSVTRGWVGVEAQNLTPELADSFSLPNASGALIADVLPNSPAAISGLKAGDILLSINDKPVINSAAMLNLIAVLEPRKNATLTIVRAGRKMDINILIGKRPAPIAQK